MTTQIVEFVFALESVVEAYRLDRYDNFIMFKMRMRPDLVVEAYRLDRYDNLGHATICRHRPAVVEAYRLDRYDNSRGIIRSCTQVTL